MRDFIDLPLSQERGTLSVSEATKLIKQLIESQLPHMWIEGEISNFIHHSSGHMYFSVKDAKATMSCTMWAGRNALLRFEPVNGMKVLLHGRITVYERRGQYQLDVHEMHPSGVGALQMAFEQLKEKLLEEGLFDESHKQELPQFPEAIGIVTSPTGAALRDLFSVLRRRWPAAELILRPALVQGDGAAKDVADAISEFNDYGNVDLLIVGRGGGSLEDLWAFNEEIVARAIHDSEIPIISSVGHEVDITIADFVADVRAATPSAAAELAVPDSKEVFALISQQISRAYSLTKAQTAQAREKLNGLQLSYGLRRPRDIVKQYSQRLDELSLRMQRAASAHAAKERMRFEALKRELNALSYESILKRGFVVIRDAEDGKVLSSVSQVNAKHAVEITFSDGTLEGELNRKN